MSIEIDMSNMPDRPAAFPKTNCSHHKRNSWCDCLAHAPMNRRSTISGAFVRCGNVAAAYVSLFVSTEKSTKFKLLTIFFIPLMQIADIICLSSFAFLVMMNCTVCCVVCAEREWHNGAFISLVCVFSSLVHCEAFMRSTLISWYPVARATVFCNKCPEFSRLRRLTVVRFVLAA